MDFADELNLAIAVTNLDKSVKWFGEHLGLDCVFVDKANGWATLVTPWKGVTLGLGVRQEVTPGGCVPTFGVKDLDKARATLEDAGVAFEGPTIEVPNVTRFATFYDLDKNAFMLAEKLS